MANTSARFDHTDDRVSYLGDGTDLPDEFTMLMWVYQVATTGTYTSLWRRFASGGSGRGQIGTDTDGQSLMWWPAGVPFNYTLTEGAWARVAVVVSISTSSVTTYAGDPSGPLTVNTGSVGTTSGANQFTFAGVSIGNDTEPFDGRIGLARLIPALLTEAEVEAEFASTTPVLSAWGAWPLATDLLDATGDSRDLTAGSTPVTFVEDGPPVGTPPSYSGTVALDATANITVSGVRASAGTVSLAATASLIESGTRSSAGTVPLAATALLDLAGSKSNAGAVVLPAGAGLEVVGSRSGAGVVGLPAFAALAVSGASARAGQVTLAASVSLIVAPTGDPVDAVDTPPERTFTVPAESRIFVVPAETRTWEA